MGNITFSGIGIKGIVATVPSNIVKTMEQTSFLGENELQKFVNTTGIQERRIALNDTCASDLCVHSAHHLIHTLDVDRTRISALVFVSQTPDYREPATSIILQDRLSLSKDIYSLDVNQACSGFVWGLITSYSLVNAGFDNVLLLAGDTPSKISSPKDSSTTLMFGDGGIAALICRDEKYGNSFFSFNTDGSEFNAVNIPGGGFRTMSSEDTLKYTVDEKGNEKNMEQIHMDGMEVFSYSVNALVRSVRNVLDFSGIDLSQIDSVVLHQANKYMNDKISRKLGIDESKSLKSIHKFGNTSCVSIPLTMADQMQAVENNNRVLCTAIGAGFTYGSAIFQLVDTVFSLEEL